MSNWAEVFGDLGFVPLSVDESAAGEVAEWETFIEDDAAPMPDVDQLIADLLSPMEDADDTTESSEDDLFAPRHARVVVVEAEAVDPLPRAAAGVDVDDVDGHGSDGPGSDEAVPPHPPVDSSWAGDGEVTNALAGLDSGLVPLHHTTSDSFEHDGDDNDTDAADPFDDDF